jgi:ribosome-associated heat shock protein Hsp15
MDDSPPRLDKWLWAVRAFKTRTQAAEACRLGRVTIAGQTVKASREIRVGEILTVKQSDFTRTLKILQPLHRRVGAAIAKEYVEDLTPPEEYQKKREADLRPFAGRPRGSGRPTKKDRRVMDLPKD